MLLKTLEFLTNLYYVGLSAYLTPTVLRVHMGWCTDVCGVLVYGVLGVMYSLLGCGVLVGVWCICGAPVVFHS